MNQAAPSPAQQIDDRIRPQTFADSLPKSDGTVTPP